MKTTTSYKLVHVLPHRPVAVSMFYAAVVLLGVVSLPRLPVDLLPDLSYPKLTVWTTYPGAAPAEVEASVTVPIEGALSTLSGLRRMGLGEPRRGVARSSRFPVCGMPTQSGWTCCRCRSSWARWTGSRQTARDA